jgi:hypothetical protein
MAEQTGFITVNVTTAAGSAPVPGAEVMISQITGGGDTVIYRYITDESGQTPLSELQTAELSNSLSSASAGPDYTLYNVTVTSAGYYPLVSLNIPVFTGITSRQPMVLIPLTASSDAGTNEYVPDCAPYKGGCGQVSEKGGPR